MFLFVWLSGVRCFVGPCQNLTERSEKRGPGTVHACDSQTTFHTARKKYWWLLSRKTLQGLKTINLDNCCMTVFILRVVVQHETQAVYEQSTCFSRFFSFGFRRGLRFQIPGGICSAPLLFCSIFRNFRDSTLARWDDTIQAL